MIGQEDGLEHVGGDVGSERQQAGGKTQGQMRAVGIGHHQRRKTVGPGGVIVAHGADQGADRFLVPEFQWLFRGNEREEPNFFTMPIAGSHGSSQLGASNR
ncbi:MAG: hypothetical protein NT083_04330 [Rhodocyclales bacterium]|nr:hypothetical protein [Rhodocyclales bacterium]